MSPPLCRDCVHATNYNRWKLCMKYGAYVFLYSSCGFFERRVGSDSPVVTEQMVKDKFSFGLVDLQEAESSGQNHE